MRERLPASFSTRAIVDAGLPMSYGADFFDGFRQVRFLHWPRPQGRETGRPAGAGSDQVRTVINRKTAKALSLTVPQSLLAIADEVIE